MLQIRAADAATRTKAISRLSSFEPTADVLGSLSAALADPSDEVREAACYSLGHYGSDAKAAVPQLASRLEDPSARVRRAAATALGSIGPAAGTATPQLIRTLSDPAIEIRRTAAAALSGIGAGAVSGKDTLAKFTLDPDPEIRASSLAALSHFGSESKAYLPQMITALGDASEPVRRAAATAIQQLGPDALPALKPLAVSLTDSSEYVQSAALGAMSAIGPSKVTAAVPDLIKAVDNGKNAFHVRANAAYLLGQMGNAGRPAIPALSRALNSDHEWVRNAARIALASLDPDSTHLNAVAMVETVAPKPAGAPNEKKRSAVDSLLDSLARNPGSTELEKNIAGYGEDAVPELVRILADSEEPISIRESVVRILTAIGYRASAANGALKTIIVDQDSPASLRIAAIGALAESRTNLQPALEALKESLADRNLREPALSAIVKIGSPAAQIGPDVAKVFEFALTSKPQDSKVLIASANALGEMGTEASATSAVLVRGLQSNDEAVRFAVIDALGRVRAANTISALVPLLHDSSIRNRAAAAFAMGQIFSTNHEHASDAMPDLIRTLSDESVETRKNAAYALGWAGTPSDAAVSAMVKALSDPSGEVRGQAALGLGILAQDCEIESVAKLAVPALQHALEDPNELTRMWAAQGLGLIGRTASTAVPTLRKVKKDDGSASVRQSASQALERLGEK